MAERGKTIRLFLIEGVPSGRWKCELSNWASLAYRIPRTMISDCSDREDLLSTGVYFLIGKTDDGMGDKVYVGEAENVLPCIFKHIGKSKEWQDWTECVTFVSKDDSLNKAMIVSGELPLRHGREADRCELVNGNRPPKSSLSGR